MIPRLALVAALALGGYLAYGIWAAGNDTSPVPTSAQQVVFNAGYADGRRIHTAAWSADYTRLTTTQDQAIVALDDVHNGVIDRNGKPYLRFRAAHMVVNTLTKDFSVDGPLEVRTIATHPLRTLTTTAASWQNGAQLLTMAQPVTIASGAVAPLVVGSLTYDIRTGAMDLRRVSGAVTFK
ncbi:MAG: hypothetical protein ACREM2_02185 [Vulcanimicrobiaceae bacterium]